MKIPFIGPTSEERSRDADYQRTVNWYVEKSAGGGLVLYPTPGSKAFTVVGQGPIRGSLVFNDLLWVVSGDKLYSVDTAGTPTERGTLSTSGGRVEMAHNGADNGQELILVDGTKGYLWDDNASTFDSDLGTGTNFPDGATHVRFFDSYFIANDPTTSGRFKRSDSYDGATWGANNFATAERDPDTLQAIEVSGREIWLFGTETTEVWYNAGNAGAMPFAPMQNAFVEWGCAAPYSVAESSGDVFWLAQNDEGKGIVLRARSIQPEIVSTWAIANEIDGFTTISDAFGFTYQFKQHIFYVLQFPTEGRTFVYDITTEAWHEWETSGADHISNTYAFFDGKHIVGDKSTNDLYQLDDETYTDNAMTITRLRRSPHISVEDKPSFHHSLVVEMQTGVGNDNDASPQIMLRWSDDGGYTWSNEYWRSLGAVGEYGTQVPWRKLGRSRDRIYEIKVTDAVNPVILAAYANIIPVERETD